VELRVLGKGLILVVVPLAVELVLISSLAYLLYQSDRISVREAQFARRNLLGSRLLSANCQAGALLVESVSRRDASAMNEVFPLCDEIDRMNREMSAWAPDYALNRRQMRSKCLKAQAAVTARLREIATAASDSVGPESLRRILKSYRALVHELDVVFKLLEVYRQQVDLTLPVLWKEMEDLQNAEKAVLGAGLVATLAGTAFCFSFYRRQFLRRIKSIQDNVRSLAAGLDFVPVPVGGADEVADLNRAFLNMGRQLKAVAERERALFDNSSDMICVLDENLNFRRANSACLRFCGSEAGQLTGRPVSSILSESPERIMQIEKRFYSARDSGTACQFEFEIQGPAAARLSTLWSVFWSPKGESCHCMVHDVSEERQLDKLRQSFLRLIAADFREPLSAIAALFEKLSGGECGQLPEKATSRIGSGTSTLTRLVGLVDELLQLETMQSAALQMNRMQHDVAQVLAEAIKDTEAAAASRKVKVVSSCPPELSFQVDLSHMTRVLTNFLSNAIKFSPEGACVRIAAETCGPDQVMVSVIDQGRGIPPDLVNSLFQPFKQVERQDGKRGKGTGLGLVTCKRIVEAHGGTVGVESEAGKGTRFWFIVPGQAAGRPEAGIPQAVQAPAPVEGAPATLVQTASPDRQSLAMLKARSPVSDFWARCSFKKKGLLLVGIPLFFQAIFAGVMVYLLAANSHFYATHLQNRYVVSDSYRLASSYFRFLVAMRSEKNSRTIPELLTELRAQERVRLASLRDHIRGDKAAEKYFNQILNFLETRMHPQLSFMESLSEHSGGHLSDSSSRRFANSVVMLTGNLTSLTDNMVADCEARNKNTPAMLVELRKYQAFALAAGLTLNIIAAAWLAVYFSSDVVRRLLVLSDNSQRLASERELNELLSGSDEIAHLDAVFHNTARQLAELRATESTFLDNANNIICALSESGRFVSLNRAAANLLSIPYASFQEYDLPSLLSAEQADAFKNFLTKLQESSVPSATELRVRAAENTLDMVWSISWSAAEHLFFAVAYDITARRELDRMKKEFLALVTHDLRAPLATILLTTVMLEDGALGEVPMAARAVLAEISTRSNQILELVNDLLDLAKLEAGELKADFSRVEFASVLEKIQALLSSQGVELRLGAPAPELVLEADAERLAYAVAGLALEIFEANSLELSPSCQDGTLSIRIAGCQSRLSPDEFAQVSAGSFSQYNPKSRQRLRLPLSVKLLTLHHGVVTLKTLEEEMTLLEVSLPAGQN
jgi:PAS domain S-box-containing protein